MTDTWSGLHADPWRVDRSVGGGGKAGLRWGDKPGPISP